MRILSSSGEPLSMREDKRNLASHRLAKLGENVRGRSPKDLFVNLGHLSCHRHVAFGQYLCENAQRAPHAVRRLEDYGRTLCLPEGLEESSELPRLARQVAGEAEARAAVAGSSERAGDGARTRQRYHCVALIPGGVDQLLPWIGE